MTINYRLLLPLLAIIILVSSCSSRFSVTKRRYMKGYHVDFAKKMPAAKTNTSSENIPGTPVKIIPEVKTTQVEANEAYVNNVRDSGSENTSTKNKKTNAFSLANSLKESKQNIATKLQSIKQLIADHKQSKNSLKAEASKAEAPFDYFRSGNIGFGAILLYAIIGIIISILFTWLLLAIFSAALGGGGLGIPGWVGGALIAIGIIVIIGIIVVVVINGD